jgi:protein-S-isoprenylcysteine O-methyltransferase Ste14
MSDYIFIQLARPHWRTQRSTLRATLGNLRLRSPPAFRVQYTHSTVHSHAQTSAMPSAAFVTPLSHSLRTSFAAPVAVSPSVPRARAFASPRRAALHMTADDKPKPTNSAAVEDDAGFEIPAFEAPTFDTEVFSNFVATATDKFEELKTQVSKVDTTALVDDVKFNTIGLVDNAIAGDWLNRGELYGAVQLLFVVLLLRDPGLLDGLIGFVVGPLTLAAGAAVSAKALFDLGFKQLSIWPAPVPDATLRTDGIYSVIRHPIYAGLVLASAGFAATSASPERLALTIALAFFLGKKIAVEENYLVDVYPEYESYMADVPFKLIPKIW